MKYLKLSASATASDNQNNAIKNSTGKLIKILFLDDFLYKDTSLEDIVKNFDMEKDHWLCTACIHTKNGSDFFLTVLSALRRRKNPAQKYHKRSISRHDKKRQPSILFDPRLVWWQDLDYYKRYYEKYGTAEKLNDIEVVIRVHSQQMSNTMATEKRREQEYHYVLKKFHVKGACWLRQYIK